MSSSLVRVNSSIQLVFTYPRFKAMYFLRILLFLTFWTLACAQSEENEPINDNKFGPLEPPDSTKFCTAVPQDATDFPDILTISDAIINFQKKLEDDHSYLPSAYLITSSFIKSAKKVKANRSLSSVLYGKLVTDNTNTSQPSVNEHLANITADNNVNCTNFVPLNQTDISVEIVNSTRLSYVLKSDPEIVNRRMSGICSLVLFYARSCQFSTLAAPHFNILPRIFPQVKMMAYNAIPQERFNTVYSITGVPSLVLFHNGKPIAKYDGSNYTLYEFTKFVIRHTDLTPNKKVEISLTDFVKTVPGFENRDYDYSLWLAWAVIIFWTLAYVRTMNFWRIFVEDIKSIWRESEEQREHAD